MLVTKCTCGAEYNVPESLAGRRVKCRKCGEPIAVPPPPDGSVIAATGVFVELPNAVDESQRPSWVSSLIDEIENPDENDGPSTPEWSAVGSRTYWTDCGDGLLFIADMSNLFNFLMIAAAAAFEPLLVYAGPFGLPGIIVVRGWICAFLFNVVVEAAAGEPDLPNLALVEGMVEDVLRPLLGFVATCLVVLAPALAYSHFAARPLLALIDSHDPIFVLLLCIGAFYWPLVLMVVAIGSVTDLVRVDRLIVTVFRTFVPYAGLVLLIAGAVGPLLFSTAYLRGASHPIALAMVMEVLLLYVGVVACRAVGLFYFHFRDRFAWSWE